MKKLLFILLIVLSAFSTAQANPDTEISTKDYMDYLNSLQTVSTPKNETAIPLLFRNLFNFKRIEEQIRIIFAPEKINRGEFQNNIRRTEHASLIVFFVALGGIAILFYGYKLLPFLIMIFGAYLGSIATYNVIERFFTVRESELLLFVIMGTVIMAIASLLLRNIFIFLFGAVFGLFISQIVLAFFSLPITNTFLFIIFVAILFAVFVLLFKRFFMIFLTSLTGSILLVFSAQYLVLELFQSISFEDQFFTYTSIIVFSMMLIFGLFFQFKTTKRLKVE